MDDIDYSGDDQNLPDRRRGESDYDWGYRVGYTAVTLWINESDLCRHYPADFRHGYTAGRAEIDRICEEVSESRYFQ